MEIAPRKTIVGWAILYQIVISFIGLMLIYNVAVADIYDTFNSLSLFLALLFNTLVILIYTNRLHPSDLTAPILYPYRNLTRLLNQAILVQVIFQVVNSVVIAREISIPTSVKFAIVLALTTYLLSLFYFPAVLYRNFFLLWAICFCGTIVLAQPIVEAMSFMRGLWFRTVLDFWTFVVPFTAVAQLQTAVLLEGWQAIPWTVINVVWIVSYGLVVISLFLYLRQTKASLI